MVKTRTCQRTFVLDRPTHYAHNEPPGPADPLVLARPAGRASRRARPPVREAFVVAFDGF
jgi:hypothetical protein